MILTKNRINKKFTNHGKFIIGFNYFKKNINNYANHVRV